MSAERATASRALAQWVVDFRLEDAPESVLVASRKALLNSITTAIGGAEINHTERALALARRDGATGPAHAIATGDALPVGMASFVNGVMVNALGQEETHVESGTHPAETTAPIALAEGEAVGADGRQLLEAFIVGMQVSGAVGGMGLIWSGQRELLAQPPSAYGAIGAAAAAARLMGLGVDQTTNAIGLGATFAVGMAESMRAGTGEYHYLKGFAGLHAHTAAVLAQAGAPVSPTALEGPAGFFRVLANISADELKGYDVVGDVRRLVSEQWVAPELLFKPYPVNYFNQPLIDGARRLQHNHGILVDEVRAVRLRVGRHPARVGALGAPPFRQRSNALMSTRFGVASMLARGRVRLEDTQSPDDPDILRVCALSTIETGADGDVGWISIETNRGTFDLDLNTDSRDFRLPLSDIVEIVTPIVADRIGRERAAHLIGLLQRVETLESVGEILAATRTDPS